MFVPKRFSHCSLTMPRVGYARASKPIGDSRGISSYLVCYCASLMKRIQPNTNQTMCHARRMIPDGSEARRSGSYHEGYIYIHNYIYIKTERMSTITDNPPHLDQVNYLSPISGYCSPTRVPRQRFKSVNMTVHISNGSANGDVGMHAATRLRQLLARGDIVIAPGVYDGFSARIALEVGFDCLYMVRQRITSFFHAWPPPLQKYANL